MNLFLIVKEIKDNFAEIDENNDNKLQKTEFCAFLGSKLGVTHFILHGSSFLFLHLCGDRSRDSEND